jgi:hypothetical protein
MPLKGRVAGQARGVAAALLVASACGGGSPSQPTPTPQPTPPPVPSTAWSVSGRVTSQSGQPISGATVAAEGLAQVTTDGSGSYTFKGDSAPADRPYYVDVRASGYLDRRVWVAYQLADRANVNVNMISKAAPFSLGFYRKLARNAFEAPGSLEILWLWEGANPKVYVRTVDQTGRPIEPEVLAGVYAEIPKAVRDWTAGRFTVTTLEHGSETRPRQDGWIIVDFTRNYSSDYCGFALIGALDGHIELVDDRCNCGSNKMPGQIVAHEIGHAMGFFHVDDPRDLMYPQASASCPAGVLSADEKYHARIAYSRTRGNKDPDSDWPGQMTLGLRPDIAVAN